MREYTVVGPGGAYTVQLSDEDAKSYGLTDKDLVTPEVKAKAVANKQASTPLNKAQAQKD